MVSNQNLKEEYLKFKNLFTLGFLSYIGAFACMASVRNAEEETLTFFIAMLSLILTITCWVSLWKYVGFLRKNKIVSVHQVLWIIFLYVPFINFISLAVLGIKGNNYIKSLQK